MSTNDTRLNPNSALYWQPRIDAVADELPVSVPESTFVEYDFTESFGLLDEHPDADLPWGEFVVAVETIGRPAFLRTDQKSVKHAGPGAYRAEEPNDIPTILATLTDYHVKANRHPAALMVREWVDINALFRAFDGLKIGREYRVFATPDGVECTHFYWPAGAIAEGRGTPTTLDGEVLAESAWREHLDVLNHLDDDACDRLHDAATAVATALDADRPEETAWSVDFAEDSDGEWWVLDAALAEDSWHPDDCPASNGGDA
jgi:hypothetical protein